MPTAAELARRQEMRKTTAAATPKSFEQRIEMVRDRLQNKNPTAAEKALRPLLISDASDPEVVMLAAEVKAARGDFVAAGAMLVESVRSDPQLPPSLLFRAAECFTRGGEHDRAEAALRQILASLASVSEPSSSALSQRVDAHRQLAALLNGSGRRIAAAPHLLALATSGDAREKELYAMIAYGDPFVDDSATDSDSTRRLNERALARAKALRDDGELTEATRLIETLAELFPESTGIAAFRGRVYADAHDDEQLRGWMSELPPGIESEPEYWFAWGVLLRDQSEHREAVRCFAEAVLRDPTDRFSYLEMSRSLTSLSVPAAAERARQKFALLEQTTRLAYQFGRRPGTEVELERLAGLLAELNRDAEAIGWRMLALKRFGGSSSAIERLASQRALLGPDGSRDENRNGNDHPDDNPNDKSEEKNAFVLCGLALSDWPLPTPPSPMAMANMPARETSGNASGADPVPIRLVDVASDIGIDFQYLNGAEIASDRVLLHQLTGGGIAVIDFDRDGWPDLYFTQAGGDAFDTNGSEPNRLFRNIQGRRYADVTNFTGTGDRGYGQGVAVADWNEDGFPDLLVANIGPNRVYINQGDGTFAVQKIAAWEQNPQWTTSLACGDIDGDGRSEIVEINYIDDPSAMQQYCEANNTNCNPSHFKPALDRIWRVESDGGIVLGDELWLGGAEAGYGFAAILADIDARFGNDLFIANDRIANHLWLSQTAASDTAASDDAASDAAASDTADEQGRFRVAEQAQLFGCATGMLGQHMGCMGIAAGDFDRNGKLDFHVTNFWNQPSDLYLQGEQGFFIHGSVSRRLDAATKQTVAWGTQAVDFDRNGWLDIAVLNGHLIDRQIASEPYRMKPQLFAGNANGFELRSPSDMQPSDMQPGATNREHYWARPTLGRTMAVLDWNRDGKPDLACNHLDTPVAILENRTVGGHAVQLELVGVTSTRDATAAVVTVVCGDERWTSWVTGGDGFLCSNESLLDIGIGAQDHIDEIVVEWPSGIRQRFTDLKPDRRYLLIEDQDSASVPSTSR